MTTINELATLCNVSEADMVSFVNCLRIWTAKGYTVEAAIEKHMDQMNRLVNNSVTLSKNPKMRELVIEWFYPKVAA